MAYENIIFSIENGIGKITLNRPDALNAFSLGMRNEVIQVIAAVRDDPSVRVLVITGAGRAFCAGGDIKGFGELAATVANARRRIHGSGHSVVEALMYLEKPVLAVVNGFALGAGCNLALACDMIIASDKAKFGEVFAKVGLMPDFCGIWLLPKLVGLHKAKELMFLADIIDAREAERIGLVNQVVPAEELEQTAMGIAGRLAKGPTQAFGTAKVLMHRALTADLGTSIEMEAMGQAITMFSADHKEGVAAFTEKRDPVFKGE